MASSANMRASSTNLPPDDQQQPQSASTNQQAASQQELIKIIAQHFHNQLYQLAGLGAHPGSRAAQPTINSDALQLAASARQQNQLAAYYSAGSLFHDVPQPFVETNAAMNLAAINNSPRGAASLINLIQQQQQQHQLSNGYDAGLFNALHALNYSNQTNSHPPIYTNKSHQNLQDLCSATSRKQRQEENDSPPLEAAGQKVLKFGINTILGQNPHNVTNPLLGDSQQEAPSSSATGSKLSSLFNRSSTVANQSNQRRHLSASQTLHNQQPATNQRLSVNTEICDPPASQPQAPPGRPLTGGQQMCHLAAAAAAPRPPLSVFMPTSSAFPWSVAARGKPRRGMMRRAVFSDGQRVGLEKRFQLQKYISKPDRKKLAEKLGLRDSQVKIWFQNRRMKWRNSKERELLSAGGSREQTLPTRNNPNPDLSDVGETIKKSQHQNHQRLMDSKSPCDVHCEDGDDDDIIGAEDEADIELDLETDDDDNRVAAVQASVD